MAPHAHTIVVSRYVGCIAVFMDSSCGVAMGPGAPYGTPCGRTVTCCPLSFAAASSSRCRRPVMKTCAPSATNRCAVARPMPLVPPVMTATLPANFRMMSFSTLSTSHQGFHAQETRDDAEGEHCRQAFTPGDRCLIRLHTTRPFRASSRRVHRRQHIHHGRDGVVAEPYLAAADQMDHGGLCFLVV